MTRNNVPNDILTSKNISEQKHLRLPLIYLAINICVKNKTNEIVKRIIKIKKKICFHYYVDYFHLHVTFENM